MVSFECQIIVKDDNNVVGARFKNDVDDDDQVGLVVRGGSNLAEAFYRNDQSSQLPLLTSSPPFLSCACFSFSSFSSCPSL